MPLLYSHLFSLSSSAAPAPPPTSDPQTPVSDIVTTPLASDPVSDVTTLLTSGAPNLSTYYDELLSETVNGAWGTRRLVSTYTGPIIRVVDLNDDSEQDVFADQDGFLNPFTTVGAARARIVYDQSGNGNDLIQTNEFARPNILQNETPGGHACLDFNGIDDFMETSLSSTHEFLTSEPVWYMGVGGRNGGSSESFGFWFSVSNSNGSDRDVTATWASTSNSTLQTITGDVDRGDFICTGLLDDIDTWNIFAWEPNEGRTYNGIPGSYEPTYTSSGTFTYTSSRKLTICGNESNGGNNAELKITEIVQTDRGSMTQTEIRNCLTRVKSQVLSQNKAIWRMLPTTDFGGGFYTFAQWDWRDTISGVDQTVPGGPSFSETFFNLAQNFFNVINDSTNTGNVWTSAASSVEENIGYDFITTRNDFYEIIFTIRNSFTNFTPKTFAMQYWDTFDETWKTRATFDLIDEPAASTVLNLRFPEPIDQHDILAMDFAYSDSNGNPVDRTNTVDFNVVGTRAAYDTGDFPDGLVGAIGSERFDGNWNFEQNPPPTEFVSFDVSSADPGSDLQVECWIKVDNAGNDNWFFGVNGLDDRNFFLEIDGDDVLVYHSRDQTNFQIENSTSNPITNNTWHLVSYVKIGNNVKVYVDGTEVLNANFNASRFWGDVGKLTLGAVQSNSLVREPMNIAQIRVRTQPTITGDFIPGSLFPLDE